MQQWEMWNRAEQEQLKEKLTSELECVSCPSCQSTWFEVVDAFQFKADHQVILGQDVPTRRPGMIPYKVFRCLRCSNLLEPLIIHNTRDHAGGDYDNFLDTLEGKNDKRTKVNLEAKIAELEAKLLDLTKALEEKPKKAKKDKDEVPSQGQ
jgi:hypothetical protein